MVKIEIDNTPLILKSSEKMRIKMRNQMMYEDVLPKYFFLPFAIPLDMGSNSFLLNYPQEWKNRNKISKKINCQAYLFGDNNPRKSVISLRNVSEMIAEADMVVDKNSDDIGDKKLSEIDMGEIILENTVYKDYTIKLVSHVIVLDDYYYPFWAVDTILVINDITFRVPANMANTAGSVVDDLATQINTSALPLTATAFTVPGAPWGDTGFIRLLANNPGTDGAFKLNNMSELAAGYDASDGTKYYFDMNVDLENDWINAHIEAVRDSVVDLITSYDPDTSLVMFPVIENTGFFEDNEHYDGFQNAMITKCLTDKENINFITPMLHLVYVVKKVFKALGFDAVGTFFEDAGIKRKIIYTNVAADFFDNFFGSESDYTAEFHIDSVINIHASKITLNRHLPDMTVRDFLTQIRSLMNLRYNYNYVNGTVDVYIIQTKTESLIQNAKDMTSRIVKNGVLSNVPDGTIRKLKLFKFENDSADGVQSVVQQPHQLPYIVDKNEEKEIAPKISSIAEQLVDSFMELPWLRLPGCYNGSGTPSKLKLLQYFGPVNAGLTPFGLAPEWTTIETSSGSIPAVFAFSKDAYPYFDYTSNWSIRWDTPKGYYEKCWKRQIEILSDGVPLRISMDFSEADLMELENNPFHILYGSVAIWKDNEVELKSNSTGISETLYQLL